MMKTLHMSETRDSGTWEHWEQAVDKISKGKRERLLLIYKKRTKVLAINVRVKYFQAF